MLRRIFSLITCVCLLSGCLSATPKANLSAPAAISSDPTLQAIEEEAAAVTPGVSDSGTLPTAMPATADAVLPPSSGETASTALISTLTPVPTKSPFFDCGRTPGIPGCNSSAPHLAGHLAFYDVAENRLIGLDLQTGQGWSVPISRPLSLQWSPDGSQLLVRMDIPEDHHGEVEYLLFDEGGKLIQPLTRDKSVSWRPQGASLYTYEQQKMIHSKGGAEAWLERLEGGKKILHFRPSVTAEWKTTALNIDPIEWQIELYDWLPGTSSILINQYPLSTVNNDTYGCNFFLFDIQTGELRFLKDFHGHSIPQFIAMREPDLALIQLNLGMADNTLAILDGKTGNISRPLPRTDDEIQPYSLQQMAWQPGESEGLFALMVHMTPTDLLNQPPTSSLFSKGGLYLYDPKSGGATLLRETPEDVIAGNFHWTADGQYLIYGLGPTQDSQNAQTDLYIRQIDTGEEWLILDRLVNANIWLSYVSWPLMSIYIG